MESLIVKVSDNLSVSVMPNENFEFLMSSKEVASGYDISTSTLRSSLKQNSSELIEDKHFIKGVRIMDTLGKGAQPHQIFWTKRGVVRLGFFVKSQRAKLFRDWAEDLVIDKTEYTTSSTAIRKLPETTKYKHNRLTNERLVSIMADICLIEDRELRERMVSKLIPN